MMERPAETGNPIVNRLWRLYAKMRAWDRDSEDAMTVWYALREIDRLEREAGEARSYVERADLN